MKISEIAEILKAEIHVGDDILDTEIHAGAATDLMSEMLRGATHGVVLITGLNNIQVIRTSVIAGVAAVILVREKVPSPEMVDHAREHELPLMSTPFTMFTSCGRLCTRGLRGIEQSTRKASDAG
jgi:predicted transcriptional regulator